jgi:hypothetical protein
MSGAIKESELRSRLNKSSNWVLSVKIIGQSTATIKELQKAAPKESPEIAQKLFYIVEVNEVINSAQSYSDDKSPWTIQLPSNIVFPISKKRNTKPEVSVKDTLFIFNAEDLGHSYSYYVENKHRIFIYETCPDLAESVNIGTTYLFISSLPHSRDNNIFYGNFKYGFFPDTKQMRNKIAEILFE